MKLRNYSFLILSFFVFSTFQLKAQSLANYTTTRTTGITYASIAATGNAMDSWRNAGTLPQDDNRSNATDIGFDFWYNGTRYTQFSVSTNGFVDFSSSAADGGATAAPYGYDNTYFTANGGGTFLALAPMYDDMTAQGGTDTLGNSIKYLTTGTAPNRVLTIEWIDMAVYQNTTPSLNFQLKLYETTGVIEFNYGTMTQGTATFSYTCGINAAVLANTPTAAQLLCQQTANSNTFNNGQQNGLVPIPASNSQIRFTPPLTTPAPTGALSFTAVGQTGMTVNWSNWCSNEVGYVLYNSTDNVNFNFVGQTAVNATNYAATGLLPSTLYYWKVYAVTEGALSTALTGSQSTTAAGTVISITTGNWGSTTTWNCGCIPTAADNVTIANTHTVTLNVNGVCNNLNVGQGASGILRLGNNNTARTLTVNSNLQINAGGRMDVSTTSNTTHALTLGGNLTNNGALDLLTDANSLCDVTFVKNGNQTISGSGATNDFNMMTLNMGASINNTLDVTSTNFTAPANFLNLTAGVFKLSTTGTVAVTPYTAQANINNKSGITVNSATATVTFGGGIDLYGNLIVNNGALTVGNANDESVASNGGVFQIFGGTVRIAGCYYSADINTLAKFTISGGTLTLPTSGSTSTTVAPFQIDGVGSTFNMSGGTIIIERKGGGTNNLGYTVTGVTSSAVTGGTLQIGNGTTPAAQTIKINSSCRVGNLLINSANATGILAVNALPVTNNITIASGTLNANSLNMSLGGTWTNNSTFTPGTGIVIFNGTAGQTIGGSVVTTFSGLRISNAAGVTQSLNTNVSGALNFTAGVINNTGAIKMTITATGSVTGAGTGKFVNGSLEKNVATGATTRNYEVGFGTTDYLPVSLTFASVTTAGNITAKVNNGDHPNIATSCLNPARSVNRYWQLTNAGVAFTNYSATCTFTGVGSDADAGSTTSLFYMAVYNGTAWTNLTQGTTTANTNQGTGSTIIGAIQIGEKYNPVITTQPAAIAVCNNTTATFTVVATGTGLTYQWQQNTGSGFTNLTNGGIYSGVLTATLTINPATSAMNNYQYRCIITSSGCGGSTTSAAAILTVNPNVAASVSISASPSNIICAGTNVTFTATPVNGGTTPSYQWKVNGANVGTNSPTYTTATLTNGNTVTCVMTSNAACVTGSPATSNTITMTVNPNLPVSVSITATSTTICPGTNVTFTATPTNGGGTPSYQWKLNGSNVGTNSPTYSNAALTNGNTITCVLTSSATPCATGSPATSNTITITVNPALPVSVSIAASPSTTICAGTSVTFTATPVNGGTPSYQWKLNGTNVGTNSPTYTNAALTNGNTITCVMTSTATCGTGSPATSNTLTMTVNPNLPASVSIAASPSNTICAGTSVTFTATPTNGGTTPSYQWKVNGANVGTNSPTYTTATLTNGNTVTCVMTSNATCATGSPATSNTITMTVNPNLPVSVSIAASPSGTVCAGTNVTFTATPTNGGTTPSYQWKLNGGNVGTNSPTYSNATLTNGNTITCVMTSNATCATGSPATSNTITMTVNPNLPVSVSISSNPSGVSCAGTLITFTAIPTNGGTTPSYQWKLNGGNVGTNAPVYTNSTLSNGDQVVCVLTSNANCVTGNPATSNTITQSITVAGTWTGVSSTNWSDAANWCGGVPATTTNVTIPAGTPFAPALSAVSNCKDINIAAGVVVDLNNNVLNVYGAFSGTGTLKGSAGSSLNIAAGTGSGGTFNMDQSTPGVSNVLQELYLNRAGASVTIGNTLNVTGSINITTGTLSAGNNLTLVSNAAGTARVGQLAAGADIAGNVTMQRYIPAGTDGWMFLCAPVTGATLQQWDDDFITGGFPGSQYPTSVTNSSIYGYDEAWPGIYDDGYTVPNNITDPIVARTGYWAYIMNTPVTVDVTGPLLKQTQNFPVTYTNDPSQPASENGWNLLANPYPSTIDWDAAGWTKTRVNNAIYMYNPTLDQYTSYVGGIGTNGGSNLIASSQAFLVQANAASPVLTLTEAAKDATDGLFIRASSTVTDDLLKLDLAGPGSWDETVIHFNAGATADFDLDYDAMKFFSFNSNVAGIASVLDTFNMSVNTFPALTNDLSVPLKVRVGVSGTYTIHVDSLTQLPEGACVVMEDLKTGIHTDLRTTTSYSFYIADTTQYPRFVIHISKPLQTAALAATCGSGTPNGMITAKGNGSGPWTYTWTDVAGVVVQTHTALSSADTLFNVAPGVYTVTVNGNPGYCGTLASTVEVAGASPILVDAVVTDASCSGVEDGGIIVMDTEGGNAPYTYSWSNGPATADNQNVAAGAYVLTVTDSTGCAQVLNFTVPQSSGITAGFHTNRDTLYLSDGYAAVFHNTSSITSAEFTWDFGDGSALDHKLSPLYYYTIPGIYTVTLIATDGYCSDTTTQVIVILPGTTTGIAEPLSGNDIKTATSDGSVDLIFNLAESTNVSVEVYSSLGQQVMEKLSATVHKDRLRLDFSDKAKGIYYIRITSERGNVITKKVVKS